MFKGLFGRGKREPDTAEKLNSNIASAIVSVVGARSIPLMPGAAQKAFKLSVDPKAEARDFVEVIESDESLSARVLKIANSVFFDRGKPTSTIEESVNLIGINELRCLLSSTTLSELFPTSNRARWQLWVNDVSTALIARSIAQRLLPAKAEAAFLGGLLHDIGKLLLLQRVSGDYMKVIEMVKNKGSEFCEAEEQLFPFDHAEVGHLIGERWAFSTDLISVIASHHKSFKEIGAGPVSVSAIVKSADIIAHALGHGHPAEFTRLRLTYENRLPEVWEVLRFPAGEQKDLLNQYQKTFELEFDLYAGQKQR